MPNNNDNYWNKIRQEAEERRSKEEAQLITNLIAQNQQLVGHVNLKDKQINELSTRLTQLININNEQSKTIEELKEEKQNLLNLLESFKNNNSLENDVSQNAVGLFSRKYK